MGGSSHNNIYTQYYEKTGSTTTYITNPKKQLGGVWYDDTNAVPATRPMRKSRLSRSSWSQKSATTPTRRTSSAIPTQHSSTASAPVVRLP